MASSAARVEANRRNALLSTGPRTAEGKAICRGNALKHGLTGEGIVVPEEDVAEVSRRFAALEAEMAPKQEMGLILVKRIALCSVRLDRSARQEAAKLSELMRNAAEDLDDRRLAEAEVLFDWIAAEPETNARRLLRTPEGVARMIRAWLAIDAELLNFERSRWNYSHMQRIENLKGRKPEDFPISRETALCKAIWDDPGYLEPGEVEGMDAADRRDYAAGKLRELVLGHVVDLRALAETFNPEDLARSRAEAATRALFDASKEGVLARKYEAATERAMYKAMDELREVEAAPDVTPFAPPRPNATPEPDEDSETMGLNVSERPYRTPAAVTTPRPIPEAAPARSRRPKNPSELRKAGRRPSA